MSDLPPHVYAVKDRHGRTRYRFFRKGWKSPYVPGEPGTPEFHRAYAAIIEAGAIDPQPVQSPRSVVPRTLDDLIARTKKTGRWKQKKPQTQHVQSRILTRFADTKDRRGRRYGDRPVSEISYGWLENVFGSMADRPAAANTLRKILAGLMDHAMRLEWRDSNPVRLTSAYQEGEGHHDWTDAEIEQYRARHPLGTMARLTLELAYNTAARKCNVAGLTRDDLQNGNIVVDHVKDNNEAWVPILATTQAALDALPAAPIRHLVTTVYGKPFTVNGLGNKMRQWCDEAGLPHCSMHGIRKATSRQLAERGATDAEGQAVTGHKKPTTFAKYRAKANRKKLAGRAISNLGALAVLQPDENEGNTDD